MSENIPFPESTQVIWNSPNKARQPVYGATIVETLGRHANYGWRKPGDTFLMANKDIIPVVLARPNDILAYPCAKPFTIVNNKLVNPCNQEVVEAEEAAEAEEVAQAAGELMEIPGIGPVASKRLVEKGITSFDAVAELSEDQLREVKLTSVNIDKVQKWQEDYLS